MAGYEGHDNGVNPSLEATHVKPELPVDGGVAAAWGGLAVAETVVCVRESVQTVPAGSRLDRLAHWALRGKTGRIAAALAGVAGLGAMDVAHAPAAHADQNVGFDWASNDGIVNFEAASGTLNLSQYRVAWSFSDNNSAQGIEVSHDFHEPANGETENAAVFVFDSNGNQIAYDDQNIIIGNHVNGGDVGSQYMPPYPTKDDCTANFGSETVGIAAVSINNQPGYFVADAAGEVCAKGSAAWEGDLSGVRLAAPVINIVATPDGQGYWMIGADGGIFNFGDAAFHGSTGNIRLNAPVVSMAPTQDNRGYWLVAQDGGVFSFGDAAFHGSTGNIRLYKPVDGIAVAPGGDGYWLVAQDGGVFTFTNKGFYGSLGDVRLAKPVIGMASTPDGKGYTLVGSDGGVFNFGDSPFYGSLGNNPPAAPVVDLSPAPANNGYYLVTSAGQVFAFGPGAKNLGNA